MVSYYNNKLKNDDPSSVVESLISMAEHDREHFSKMISSLLPVLSKLTSGELERLLSPRSEEDVADDVMRDMAEIISNKSVLYVGLDTLTNQEVGSAVGSLILADLTAVAGARAKYPDQERESVNVFVDEAAMGVACLEVYSGYGTGRGESDDILVADFREVDEDWRGEGENGDYICC